jgi:hypothetical protein
VWSSSGLISRTTPLSRCCYYRLCPRAPSGRSYSLTFIAQDASSILHSTPCCRPGKSSGTARCEEVYELLLDRVAAAHQQAAATRFCKSYVGQTTITTIVKSTSTSTTTLQIASSCGFPNKKRDASPTPAALAKGDVVLKRDTLSPRQVVEERDWRVTRRAAVLLENRTVKKHSCLTAYSPGAALTSACSCFGITRGTSTSTLITTTISTVTTSVTAAVSINTTVR